jgi:hypothetical protein
MTPVPVMVLAALGSNYGHDIGKSINTALNLPQCNI